MRKLRYGTSIGQDRHPGIDLKGVPPKPGGFFWLLGEPKIVLTHWANTGVYVDARGNEKQRWQTVPCVQPDCLNCHLPTKERHYLPALFQIPTSAAPRVWHACCLDLPEIAGEKLYQLAAEHGGYRGLLFHAQRLHNGPKGLEMKLCEKQLGKEGLQIAFNVEAFLETRWRRWLKRSDDELFPPAEQDLKPVLRVSPASQEQPPVKSDTAGKPKRGRSA